jgi:class 3 adenylate cyclase
MARVCPNCGTEAGDGDRFCSAYGTALEPFFETARNSLCQHGGTIEKYVGDAVLAVFGVPKAHGDGSVGNALFEEIVCPYQAARSGWLLGGEAKEAAGRAFERLGATLPAD